MTCGCKKRSSLQERLRELRMIELLHAVLQEAQLACLHNPCRTLLQHSSWATRAALLGLQPSTAPVAAAAPQRAASASQPLGPAVARQVPPSGAAPDPAALQQADAAAASGGAAEEATHIGNSVVQHKGLPPEEAQLLAQLQAQNNEQAAHDAHRTGGNDLAATGLGHNSSLRQRIRGLADAPLCDADRQASVFATGAEPKQPTMRPSMDVPAPALSADVQPHEAALRTSRDGAVQANGAVHHAAPGAADHQT